jgi:tRNA(His) 5'-end guanylyltransferase
LNNTISLDIEEPIIIKLRGNDFRYIMSELNRPFDFTYINTMIETAKCLCHKIDGVRFGYIVDDEISLVITYNNIDDIFDKNKFMNLISTSAAIATMKFNKIFCDYIYYNNETLVNIPIHNDTITRVSVDKYIEVVSRFDVYFRSKVFNLKKENIVNYFKWKQHQSIYYYTSICDINKYDVNISKLKNGICIIPQNNSWIHNDNMPIFTEDDIYIRKYIMGVIY